MTRGNLDKRVNEIMPKLEAIAESENTDLVPLLIIVLVKLCQRITLGFKELAKLCPKCGATGHQIKCPSVNENPNKTESDRIVEDIFIG